MCAQIRYSLPLVAVCLFSGRLASERDVASLPMEIQRGFYPCLEPEETQERRAVAQDPGRSSTALP